MSTKQDVVSEARALLTEREAAKAACEITRARYHETALDSPERDMERVVFDAALDRAEDARDALSVSAPRIIEALLARLDALAPLAEAAARVREARAAAGLASAAYSVAYDAWRVSPETHAAAVSRCLGESEQARRVLHDAERALLAHLALARGER